MNQKGIPSITVYYNYNSSTMTMTYSYDLEDGDEFTLSFSMEAPGSKWDQANWDSAQWGASGGKPIRKDLDGRGRLIRFNFKNSVVDEEFQINGIGFNAHLETQV